MIDRDLNRWLLAGLAGLVVGMAACNSTPPVVNEPAVPEVAEVPGLAEPTTPAPTVSAPSTLPPAVTPPLPSPTPVPSPSVMPTDTPLPPEPEPQTYIVEEFDTLLGIAVAFDTTTQAIAQANEMDVDDFLQIGQELIIPNPEAVAAVSGGETAAVDPSTIDQTAGEASSTNGAAPTARGNEGITNTATEAQPVVVPAQTANLPSPPVVSLPANINPLTGLPVDDPTKLNRRPLLVRIGNDVGARASQVGFNSADMVYEEITEWWVTRFTAIFLSQTPDTVAPIRSTRLVNVQLAPQYQGALAHSGGSDAVRWEVSQAPIVNLDEYFSPAPYFYRPNQGWQTRLAVNTQAARDYMVRNSLEAPVKLPGFLFSDTISKGEAGQDIYIPYPQATSFTEWHYDSASGKYLRWINGAPLTDVSSGQVGASNVVIYFAEHQATDIVEDANGATSIRIIVNGSGPAWLFRDGKLNKGFWHTDGTRPPYFTHADGQPYPLKKGNTWVELVPTYYKIGLKSADEASARP